MLYAGDLRHSIRLQALQESVDSGGGHARVWTDIGRTHAHITPVSGGEWLRSEQVQSHMTHRVTLRWLPGLTSKMRLLFGDRVFNVRMVRNLDERRRWIELMCEEGVAQ